MLLPGAGPCALRLDLLSKAPALELREGPESPITRPNFECQSGRVLPRAGGATGVDRDLREAVEDDAGGPAEVGAPHGRQTWLMHAAPRRHRHDFSELVSRVSAEGGGIGAGQGSLPN